MNNYPPNYLNYENKQYLREMLNKGWKVYIYRRGNELIPTGVQWMLFTPAFIIKPKVHL